MKYKIKELMNVYRGASPRPIIKYLSESGYRWLKISDFKINDRYVYDTKEHIIESGIKKTRYMPKGTLILTNSATPGIPIFLGNDMCLHDGFLYFKNINFKILNIKFLYYWFLYNRFKIVNQANGSVFQNLKKEIVENFEIEVPNMDKQLKIIKILEGINDKIEINNQINDNLLDIIDTLYKDTFKDIGVYDKAENIADITIGKTPPRSEKECFTDNDNDMKWISISDLGKSGIYIFNTSEKLTMDSIKKYNVKVIPKDTLILSFKLTIGRIAITTENMTTNEAIAHFNLKNENMKYYLYSYLKNFDYAKLGSTSSIATAVNSKIIKSMPIGIPNEMVINNYNKRVQSMFEKILNNEKENQELEQLRDTLLPKLINGEINLDKIEI